MTLDGLLLQSLRHFAPAADTSPSWPAASFNLLREHNVTAWSIPREYGGTGISTGQLLDGYRQLASACLTTAFILSQREGAIRRLVASKNHDLAAKYLPPLARGDVFATIGVAQLTTSRQHESPAMKVTETANGYRLEGVAPWITAADQANLLVIGATLPDDRQILIGVPGGQRGVKLGKPLPLMALVGSRTCSVSFDGVELEREWLIAGPAEKIMAGRPGGVGGLETSSLALGHGDAAVAFIADEASRRPDLTSTSQRLRDRADALRTRLLGLAAMAATQEEMTAVRVECTLFALQSTQLAMTIAKGAGFVVPHLVQRLARQALFFLVWSCPRPTAEGLVEKLMIEG